MFHQYHLRSTSGFSRAASSHSRTPSLSVDSQDGSPGVRLASGSSHITPNHESAVALEDSVDDPVSLGVQRRQDDSLADSSTQLTPQRVKHLKAHARKLCMDLSINEKPIFKFIETGDLFSMLVDIKATFVKYNASNKSSQLQMLQETLVSKDFEAGLSNRLLACILSPNLTTYVTDTQRHIMDFISDNLEIFKIDPTIFNDSKLQAMLGKTVTRLLSDIRSHLKANLTTSIARKMCIIDVAKMVARSSTGMEVDATHWTRLAFLHCCLHLFLIGTGDHKIASLDACFTPCLIPLLKSDMRKKVKQDLGIDLDTIDTHSGSDTSDSADNGSTSPGAPLDLNWTDLDEDGNGNGNGNDNDGADGEVATTDDLVDDLDISDSGFGLDGKPVHFNMTKFWNYVDYMLNVVCQTARQSAPTEAHYDQELGKYMVQIFQDDLAVCPGSHCGNRLVAVVNPAWQAAIQQHLVW